MDRKFLVLGFFFSVLAYSQDGQIDLFSSQACTCISKIDSSVDEDIKLEEINICIKESSLKYHIEKFKSKTIQPAIDTLNQLANLKKTDSTIINADNQVHLDEDYNEFQKYLFNNCVELQNLLSIQDTQHKNSMSKNPVALKHYDSGNKYLSQGDYKKSINEYKKALKVDPLFAFAWDNLGLSYRKDGNYKKAIECYNKSLELDPKGKMPLLNKAIALEFMNKYDDAINAFDEYNKLYPGDPEVFYGMGRLYHLKKDYTKALENMILAYLSYKKVKSPYINDAETLISIFYKEMKDNGKTAEFNEIAKKYNISIEE